MRKESRDCEELERAAHRSIEARQGSPFTDEEWREAKANLIALARLLAEWQLQAGQQAAPDPTPPVTTTAPRQSRTPRVKKRRK